MAIVDKLPLLLLPPTKSNEYLNLILVDFCSAKNPTTTARLPVITAMRIINSLIFSVVTYHE